MNSAEFREAWRALNSTYGKLWDQRYGGEDAIKIWFCGLADLSVEDFQCGLAAVIDSGETWPPTLPAFRAMCKPPPKPAAHRTPQLGLPPPNRVTAPGDARAHLAAIRQTLTGRTDGH